MKRFKELSEASESNIDSEFEEHAKKMADRWDGSPEHARILQDKFKAHITHRGWSDDEMKASVGRTSPGSYAHEIVKTKTVH